MPTIKSQARPPGPVFRAAGPRRQPPILFTTGLARVGERGGFSSHSSGNVKARRTVKSLEGQMLVAALTLRDSNFHRSVVVIIKHSDDGTLGLILNRPSGTKIAEIWNQVSSAPCRVDQPIHTGGPIQGPLMALHSTPDLAEIEVVPGVYFTAARENLERIVSATEPAAPHSARFFVGYAGWGPGQLEAELDAGAWLTAAATVEQVFQFDDPWEGLARQIGGSQLLASLGIKHIPRDPRLN